MSTAYRNLRRRAPYLTPPFVSDDEQADMFYRTRLPRIPIPVDDDEAIEGAAIPALTRPPLSVTPTAPPVEFGTPYGSVPTLARPPLHDIDRIAALGDTETLPTSEANIPLLSRTPQMPQSVTPPTVAYDPSGRPTPTVLSGDPEQQVLARRRALETYQPQKESKKSLALRTILGFVGGGLAGRGGVAETLLGAGGILDRRGKDRAWQHGELGRVDEQYGRMRADRRAGLQDRLLESQVAENEAQAQRALREPPVKPPPLARRIPPVKQVDEAGNEYLADAETGEPLLDAKGNYRYTGRAKPAPPVKPDPAPIKRSAFEQEEADLTEQKTKLQADAQRYTQEAEVYNSWLTDPSKTLDQRDEAVREAQRRRAEVDRINGQIRVLERGIATARRQARSQGAPPVTSSATRGGGITEQAIRDAAKARGLDADQAVKRARARGMIR